MDTMSHYNEHIIKTSVTNFLEEDENKSEEKGIHLGSINMESGKFIEYNESDLEGEEDPNNLDPNEIVIEEPNVTIKFNYPFRITRYIKFSNDGSGFTRKQIIDLILNKYKKIYEDRENWQIYGHALGDLLLHSMERHNDHYILGIDS